MVFLWLLQEVRAQRHDGVFNEINYKNIYIIWSFRKKKYIVYILTVSHMDLSFFDTFHLTRFIGNS